MAEIHYIPNVNVPLTYVLQLQEPCKKSYFKSSLNLWPISLISMVLFNWHIYSGSNSSLLEVSNVFGGNLYMKILNERNIAIRVLVKFMSIMYRKSFQILFLNINMCPICHE